MAAKTWQRALRMVFFNATLSITNMCVCVCVGRENLSFVPLLLSPQACSSRQGGGSAAAELRQKVESLRTLCGLFRDHLKRKRAEAEVLEARIEEMEAELQHRRAAIAYCQQHVLQPIVVAALVAAVAAVAAVVATEPPAMKKKKRVRFAS